MPANDIADERTPGPPVGEKDMLPQEAPPGVGVPAAAVPAAAERPVRAAAAAGKSLEYWYFFSDDSPFRAD